MDAETSLGQGFPSLLPLDPLRILAAAGVVRGDTTIAVSLTTPSK